MVAGPGLEGGEGDAVVLVRLLHAGGLEVLQDHAGEVLCAAVAELVFGDVVDELVVFVHPEQAVQGGSR